MSLRLSIVALVLNKRARHLDESVLLGIHFVTRFVVQCARVQVFRFERPSNWCKVLYYDVVWSVAIVIMMLLANRCASTASTLLNFMCLNTLKG